MKRAEIREQIEYGLITDACNREQVDEFVEIMLEVALAKSPTSADCCGPPPA